MKNLLGLLSVSFLGCSAGSSPIGAAELAAAHCASLPICPIGSFDWALVDRLDAEVCEARLGPMLYEDLSFEDQAQARACLSALERSCPLEWWYRSGHDWLLPACRPLRRVAEGGLDAVCSSGAECADGLSCLKEPGDVCGTEPSRCGVSTFEGITDLWIEDGSFCTNHGCDGYAYGELAVAEGQPCGEVDDLHRNVCAPGLACVYSDEGGVCRRPARAGEACEDSSACGPGLLCSADGLCERPVLGERVGDPCFDQNDYETCDTRRGLACVDVGPEGPRCARASEAGDPCRWDVPTCGAGLRCGGAARCEPIPSGCL
ncbi:MAG: hypothetical protein MUE69_12120 [Myxococcota bacterium]|nr:hypothetical protein [Myxococcota bacterium]